MLNAKRNVQLQTSAKGLGLRRLRQQQALQPGPASGRLSGCMLTLNRSADRCLRRHRLPLPAPVALWRCSRQAPV